MKTQSSRFKTWLSAIVPICACTAFTAPALADASFTAFESGHVRPLALSPNGKLLYAVNTPDNRLEVFRVTAGGLEHRSSISVGMEPVAVAARTNDEVWVVNHLSDSVSVVSVSDNGYSGSVTRTIRVGDEPRDIVFAGAAHDRAFVTTAHRGQNSPVNAQLTTAGVGRADVWVLGTSPSPLEAPLAVLTLFADTPRALAVSPDGSRVYAAAFHSGNRTTTINETLLHDTPFGTVDLGGRTLPGPSDNFQGLPAPSTGLIVRFNGSHWVDENGTAWDDKVKLSLPDKDVFVIDANANPPAETASPFAGVGTILYNMAVNPVSGKVYVSNTEALNERRFEGPGTYAGHSVRGHFAENRITVLKANGAVQPRHLNKHVNYASCCAPTPNAESQLSLALPTGMAVSSDGKRLFVAAMGSSKVGIFDTAALENDTFQPSAGAQVALTGGGPTGLVLDSQGKRLFVMTRFDNSISIVDTALRTETDHVPMHNPEPQSLTAGRRFLYDARLSAHGDSACATCHVFGDNDDLAWDLGNPDEVVMADPGPFAPANIPGFLDPATGVPINPLAGPIVNPSLHPMKGPMTTQSLRGMANHGPMHWRGDHTGGSDAASVMPDQGAFDERAAFVKFQGGFINVLGRSGPLPDADMEAFADFILQVTYPPNPVRALDGSLTPDQAKGHDLFFGNGVKIGPGASCQDCHTLDTKSNIGSDAPGFFGTNGRSSFDFAPQLFKVPHLRNLYQKVGMFGMAPSSMFVPGNNGSTGDQVRGFGFSHDGSLDTLFRFHSIVVFAKNPQLNPFGFEPGPQGDLAKRQIEAYLLAMDSNMAPIVGQQVTARKGNFQAAVPRIALLRARAEEGECELTAKTNLFGRETGFYYLDTGKFATDVQAIPPLPVGVLLTLSLIEPVTFTCVPLGSGERIALDRDGDGALDGDEYLQGSDPDDANSLP